MTISKLTAEEIAKHQLLAAFRLWKEGDFLCALTLAGASEEILGKRLRRKGKAPSFDQIKAEIVDIAAKYGTVDSRDEADIGRLINQTRNELKHYSGDKEISFDLRSDAEEMLERAFANYHLLSGVVLSEAAEYWGRPSDA